MRKVIVYALLAFCVVFCLTLVGCALLTVPVGPDGSPAPDPIGGFINTANQASPLIPGAIGGIVGLLTGLIQIIRERRKVVKATDFSAVLIGLIQTAREDPKFAAKFADIVKDVLEGEDIPIGQYTDLVNAVKAKYGIGALS